jgi:Methyltransferase domain
MAGLAMTPLVEMALSLGAVQIPEELEQLIRAVCDIPLRNVMEIGSEAGGSFYVWCQLASGIKISLDLPTGASGSGKFADYEALRERSQRLTSWGGHVIVSDSHSPIARGMVRSALNGQLLDFLFIDGDHTYEGVKADYLDYKSFVRPGGLIAFHYIKDTEHHRYRGCFVADFWRELVGDKKEFLGPQDWGGIGAIAN